MAHFSDLPPSQGLLEMINLSPSREGVRFGRSGPPARGSSAGRAPRVVAIESLGDSVRPSLKERQARIQAGVVAEMSARHAGLE